MANNQKEISNEDMLSHHENLSDSEKIYQQQVDSILRANDELKIILIKTQQELIDMQRQMINILVQNNGNIVE